MKLEDIQEADPGLLVTHVVIHVQDHAHFPLDAGVVVEEVDTEGARVVQGHLAEENTGYPQFYHFARSPPLFINILHNRISIL